MKNPEAHGMHGAESRANRGEQGARGSPRHLAPSEPLQLMRFINTVCVDMYHPLESAWRIRQPVDFLDDKGRTRHCLLDAERAGKHLRERGLSRPELARERDDGRRLAAF